MSSTPFPRGQSNAGGNSLSVVKKSFNANEVGTSHGRQLIRIVDVNLAPYCLQDALFGNKKRLLHVEVVPSKASKKKSKTEETIAATTAALAPAVPVGLEGMTQMSTTSATPKVAHINAVSFRMVNVGTNMCGYVLHIAEDHLVLSLPGGLTGTVAYTEVSDTIHKLHQKQVHAAQSNTFGKRKLVKGIFHFKVNYAWLFNVFVLG